MAEIPAVGTRGCRAEVVLVPLGHWNIGRIKREVAGKIRRPPLLAKCAAAAQFAGP